MFLLLPVTAPFFRWLNLGMMRSEIMHFHTRVTAIPAARCAVMDPCAHITHKWVWLQVIIQIKQTVKSGMSDAIWMLQMVWASSNRVGCAIQTCYNMVVWGAVWREATYLVCNYSPKLVMFCDSSQILHPTRTQSTILSLIMPAHDYSLCGIFLK